jgi:hypothetical protein
LHRVGFGLALIVAFSVGLALSITGLGPRRRRRTSRVRAAQLRRTGDPPAARRLGAIIVIAGVAMTVRALPGVH